MGTWAASCALAWHLVTVDFVHPYRDPRDDSISSGGKRRFGLLIAAGGHYEMAAAAAQAYFRVPAAVLAGLCRIFCQTVWLPSRASHRNSQHAR